MGKKCVFWAAVTSESVSSDWSSDHSGRGFHRGLLRSASERRRGERGVHRSSGVLHESGGSRRISCAQRLRPDPQLHVHGPQHRQHPADLGSDRRSGHHRRCAGARREARVRPGLQPGRSCFCVQRHAESQTEQVMTTLQIQTRRYDLLSFNTLEILHLNKNVTFFFFYN